MKHITQELKQITNQWKQTQKKNIIDSLRANCGNWKVDVSAERVEREFEKDSDQKEDFWGLKSGNLFKLNFNLNGKPF